MPNLALATHPRRGRDRAAALRRIAAGVVLAVGAACSDTVQVVEPEAVADSHAEPSPDTPPPVDEGAAADLPEPLDVQPPDTLLPADVPAAPDLPACRDLAEARAEPETACGLAPAAPTALVCGDVTVTPAAFGQVLRLRHAGPAPEPSAPTGAVVVEESALGVGVACDGTMVVCTTALIAELHPCRVVVRDDTKVLVDAAIGPDPKKLHRGASPTRRLYGLGPKTGPLDRSGRKYSLWNTDAYDSAFGGYAPAADPLYQSIPFLLVADGARAHGHFIDNAWRQTWDLTDGWHVTVAGGVIDEYIVPGPSVADAVNAYTALTGRPALPPRWALGYHQSRWGIPDEAVFRALADRMRSEQIPCDSLWFDIQKLRGFRSFTWDPVTFPAPDALLAQLHAQGFRSVAIVDPGIAVDPAWDIYSEGLAAGHFLGDPYVGAVWPGPSVFPDFTSAKTQEWWAGLVPRETALGIDGLWIDMNEPSDFTPGQGGTVPDSLPVAAGGTMAGAHNLYALREAEATRRGLSEAYPERRPFLLTRAGYAGIQRAAMAWTGDAPSRADVLRDSVPMLLGMGLSGTPFVGTDVGGYSGSSDPRLFVRWMALGSVSPFFRAHAERTAPPSMPWDFGTEARDASRALIQARYRLLPTWYSLAHEAHRTGAPLLRPVFWHHPELVVPDDQYLVGERLLVAPFLDPAVETRSVVFPPGRWFDVGSGAAVDGPTTLTVSGRLAALPMWAQTGAVVARGPLAHTTDAAPGPLELAVYGGVESSPPATTRLTEDAGDGPPGAPTRTLELTVERAAGTLRLSATPSGDYSPAPRRLVLRFQRVDSAPVAVSLDGTPVPAAPDATAEPGWSWDPHELSVVVSFDEPVGAWLVELSGVVEVSTLAPDVSVPLEVRVPEGTTGVVHVATSANGWTHQPLAWVGPGRAAGRVLVPRGRWFEYKFTRGGWETVEKWPGCAEATNRYAYGSAHPEHLTLGEAALTDPGKSNEVYAWADACP